MSCNGLRLRSACMYMNHLTVVDETRLQGILTVAHHSFEKGLTARAFFKVNNHTVSDDLVQETFTKTWMYLVKGGEISTMKAFLYHILNHLIIDEYRKRKTLSLDVLIENGFEKGDDTQERLYAFLDGKKALLLITSLPPMYRVVMRMRYVQELSLQEIAKSTGKTANTVAVQVHRGLEKLKVLYERGVT